VVDGGEAGAEEVVVFGELAAFGFAEGFGGDAGEQELRGAEGVAGWWRAGLFEELGELGGLGLRRGG
jgi:hypothetical protein